MLNRRVYKQALSLSLSPFECESPRFSLRARGAIRMPTQIRIRTSTSTPIIHGIRRCVDLPVRHTLRFIAMAPIAPLAHVTLLLEHLLLRPDTMALCVVPLAGRG